MPKASILESFYTKSSYIRKLLYPKALISMNGKSLLKRKSILKRKFHETYNMTRQEMRSLPHPSGRHLLLLAALVSLLSLAGCGNRADISEGEAYIQELENRDVNAMQQAITQAQKARSGDAAGGSSREARKAAIERFRANYEAGMIAPPDEVQLAQDRNILKDCAVIGDSMAQAVLEYGFLDEAHVFFERGAIIRELKGQIEAASAMLPRTVVFFTGLNDTDHETVDSYVEAYASQIAYVKSLLPDAEIFICSMTPPSDDLAAEREDLAMSVYYADALKTWCEENDILCLDLSFLVSQDRYLEDGIHFNYTFYEGWIGLLAEAVSAS